MGLLGKLAALISQYTVADTAYVISIVSGLATVIAAVGAIIAVVMTRRISREQIRIAEKQNEIAAAQVEIAKQQNKIALFKERENAYLKILSLFEMYGKLHERIFFTDFDYISMENERENNMFYRLGLLSQKENNIKRIFNKFKLSKTTLSLLLSIVRLFTLDNKQLDYIKRMTFAYNELMLSVSHYLNSDLLDISSEESRNRVEIAANRLQELFEDTRNKEDLLIALEEQLSVSE